MPVTRMNVEVIKGFVTGEGVGYDAAHATVNLTENFI